MFKLLRSCSLSFIPVLILVAAVMIVSAACAGKKAATPEAQAVLDAQASMHQLAVDHQTTATTYFKGCTATPRTIDVASCNAWDTADTAWRPKYRDVGTRLTLGATGASVAGDIADLRATLNKYKR